MAIKIKASEIRAQAAKHKSLTPSQARKKLSAESGVMPKSMQLDVSLRNWISLHYLIEDRHVHDLADALMLCNAAIAISIFQDRVALKELATQCMTLLCTPDELETKEKRQAALTKFAALTKAIDKVIETTPQNVLHACTDHAKAIDNMVNYDSLKTTLATQHFLDVLNGKSIKSVAEALGEPEAIVKDNMLSIAVFLSRICGNPEFMAQALRANTITAMRKMKTGLTNMFHNYGTIVSKSREAGIEHAKMYGLPTAGLTKGR